MDKDTEGVPHYLVAVAIATILVWYDMRLFALYSFMVVVGLLMFSAGRLWKLIRVSHYSINAKILAIAKKVGVSADDFDRVAAEIRVADPAGTAGIERNFRDL